MKYYKINDKLVKANSLKSAIGLVKDSAASDIVKAITGMERGWKLTYQSVGNTRGRLEFISDDVNKENHNRVADQLEYILQKKLNFSVGQGYTHSHYKKEKDKVVSVALSLSTAFKPAKLIVMLSYESAIGSVKDSVASDIVTAINGLGQGWKLTKQTSQKEKGGRRSHLEFKNDKFVNENVPKMVKGLEHVFQKLGYKESIYGDFINQRNGNILTPDYYKGMASILIFEKDNK